MNVKVIATTTSSYIDQRIDDICDMFLVERRDVVVNKTDGTDFITLTAKAKAEFVIGALCALPQYCARYKDGRNPLTAGLYLDMDRIKPLSFDRNDLVERLNSQDTEGLINPDSMSALA